MFINLQFMTKAIFLMFLIFAVLPACDTPKEERDFQAKETELNQKEQELLMKEKSLELKEEELAKREQLLDSTANKDSTNSLSALHQNIPGVWNVTMRCTQTTCPGSAVGDTRNEQWKITFQNNTVIATAIKDKKFLRIYSGTYIGNSFELSAQPDTVDREQTAEIIVRLQKTKDNEMAGLREIIRPEDCRILYALELSKQQ